MGLFYAKSLFHQNPKNPSFPGVFLSSTRNPGFKILPRIGNTTCYKLLTFTQYSHSDANYRNYRKKQAYAALLPTSIDNFDTGKTFYICDY